MLSPVDWRIGFSRVVSHLYSLIGYIKTNASKTLCRLRQDIARIYEADRFLSPLQVADKHYQTVAAVEHIAGTSFILLLVILASIFFAILQTSVLGIDRIQITLQVVLDRHPHSPD